MYTILLNESNELITTVKERIMQRSKLVDNLHFLVDPDYKGIDMSDFTVTMEYILPVSREYKTENLVKSDELYKDKLEYKLPFDTCLTKEAGKIEVQLTFAKVELDADGASKQMVRKTSPVMITIVPISAWSDIIADSALTALDQRILQTQAMLEAANEMVNYLDLTKADNIIYDREGKFIQLTANGTPIGNKITLDNECKCSIVTFKIDENGDLIAVHNDGTEENLGHVSGGDGKVSVYVPDISEDGMLTFTLTEDPQEKVLSFDIDKNNDWIPIDGVEQDSGYVWAELI